MQKLSYEEIKAILESELFEEHDLNPEQWMQQDIPNYGSGEDLDCEVRDELAKLGAYDLVDEYGGEGQGDDYYAIYYFKDHDVYVKFSGWYASHYGSEYSDMEQVFPEEITVTKYVTKKSS